MTTEATTNLLRAVGEALAPFLPEGGSVDTDAIQVAIDNAVDEIDFDDKIDVDEKVSQFLSYHFDPSDYDIMTEGNFDPSYYSLVTEDEVDEKIDDNIDRKLADVQVVTADNILSILADALGGLPAVEQAA